MMVLLWLVRVYAGGRDGDRLGRMGLLSLSSVE